MMYNTVMQKYAFLDRDGTFIWEPEKPEGVDPRETFPLKSINEFKFIDDAIEGIKTLVDKGYKLVMVSNQTFLCIAADITGQGEYIKTLSMEAWRQEKPAMDKKPALFLIEKRNARI